MSSSAREKSNSPASISRRIVSRPSRSFRHRPPRRCPSAASIRAWALRGRDVLAEELPVEIDRGVDLLHDGVGAFVRSGRPTCGSSSSASGAPERNDGRQSRTGARSRSSPSPPSPAVAGALGGIFQWPVGNGNPARRPPIARRRAARRRSGWRRSPRARSPPSGSPIAPEKLDDLAFKGPDGADRPSPRSPARRCSSTSGRPGACPAGPRCRPSTGCRRPGAATVSGRGGQCRPQQHRAAPGLPRRDRRERPRLLFGPDHGAARQAQGTRPRLRPADDAPLRRQGLPDRRSDGPAAWDSADAKALIEAAIERCGDQPCQATVAISAADALAHVATTRLARHGRRDRRAASGRRPRRDCGLPPWRGRAPRRLLPSANRACWSAVRWSRRR